MRWRFGHALVTIGACGVVVAGPLLAAAQQRQQQPRVKNVRQRMSGEQRWWKNQAKATELGLSEEQLQKLEEMADLGVENARSARQRYFRAYRGLLTALTEHQPDSPEVAEAKAEAVDAWSAMTSVGIDQMIEMRKILSDEQWQRLPEVVPRALRIGNVSFRGQGTIAADPSEDGS